MGWSDMIPIDYSIKWYHQTDAGTRDWNIGQYDLEWSLKITNFQLLVENIQKSEHNDTMSTNKVWAVYSAIVIELRSRAIVYNGNLAK